MRLMLTLSLSAASLILLIGGSVELADASGFCLFPDLRQRDEVLTRLRGQRDDFEPRLAAIIDEVAAGRSCLRHAAEAIERCAAAHHPTFLEHLDVIEKGDGIHAKIASNLLRNFKRPSENGASAIDAQRLEQLTREFSALFGLQTAAP